MAANVFLRLAGLLTRSGSRIVLVVRRSRPGFAAVVAPAFRGIAMGASQAFESAHKHTGAQPDGFLSHDPAAGDIGSQLVEIGGRGLAAGNATTMPTMTGLVPAGGEENPRRL
ncbi:hypothetical protein ABLN97_06320 [Mycobacterium tuberculosis]